MQDDKCKLDASLFFLDLFKELKSGNVSDDGSWDVLGNNEKEAATRIMEVQDRSDSEEEKDKKE